MKNHKFTNKLPLTIAIGFFLGLVLGFIVPQFALQIKVLGDIYLGLLKMLMMPIMFLTVLRGILQLGESRRIGKLLGATLGTFVIMFILCSVLSLLLAWAIDPGQGFTLPTEAYTAELPTFAAENIVKEILPVNPLAAMVEGKVLPSMLFAAFIGFATLGLGEVQKRVHRAVDDLTAVFFRLLNGVMWTSPLGVMVLMAHATAAYGPLALGAIGRYILTCYLACIVSFIAVMVIPSLWIGKLPLKQLGRSLARLWPVTLATTSSAASLGVALETCQEDLQVSPEVANFVLPLGNTINMCGGACSFSCLAMFAASVYGIPLGASQLITLVLVATLMNMSAPGIPGGGILLGATFLTTLGLPITIMGPIAAVYRLLDMAFTTMNVTGDLTAAVLIDRFVSPNHPHM